MPDRLENAGATRLSNPEFGGDVVQESETLRPHPLLAEFPVVVSTAVRWGEMDPFEHVNNVHFFRYLEVARIAYFDAIDFRGGQRVGPILGSTGCRFRRPLRYPDSLQIGVRVSEVQDDRFTHEYLLISETLDEVAAVGEGLIVSYDYRSSTKTPLPPSVRKKIQDLEARKRPSPG